jgi:hypothetical protein
VLKATIYRQNIFWSPNLIPQLLSFLVNLIFLIFLDFLKTSNINIDSNEQYLKNNTLKVERIPKIFENLNSFETMLKMLKTMQIY